MEVKNENPEPQKTSANDYSVKQQTIENPFEKHPKKTSANDYQVNEIKENPNENNYKAQIPQIKKTPANFYTKENPYEKVNQPQNPQPQETFANYYYDASTPKDFPAKYTFRPKNTPFEDMKKSSVPKQVINSRSDLEDSHNKTQPKVLSTEQIRQDFFKFLASKNISFIEYSQINFSRNDKIGGGGSGTVYKGLFLKSSVAIKEYIKYNIYDKKTEEDEDYQTLISEIAKANSLSLPKFNRCFGASLNNEGVLYTIHELAEFSLATKLKEKLSLQEKNKISGQILEIMYHLYKKKTVHRDLKPENFLISKNEVQICDFGTIRTIKGEIETKTLNNFFTPQYAPPEIVNEENVIGLYSDVWSLGVILYEIYYGEKFWGGIKNAKISVFMEKQEFPKVKLENINVPKEIQQIIKGSLVYDREKRMDLMKIMKLFDSMK